MRFPERARDLYYLVLVVSSAKRPDWLWGPFSALFIAYRGLSPLDIVFVKLAILIYRCGRNEWSIPPAPPLVPSCHAQGQLQDCSRKTSNVMTGCGW
jgi:hypothetical protein